MVSKFTNEAGSRSEGQKKASATWNTTSKSLLHVNYSAANSSAVPDQTSVQVLRDKFQKSLARGP
jgi:hypothetical protein